MCRNIDFMAADAFYSGRKWQLSNTRTEAGEMWLHGHKIARLVDGVLYICLCGWNTLTTRARLNALHGVNLKQIKGEPYLNGVKISASEWIRV